MWNPSVNKYTTLPKPSHNPCYLGFSINPKSGHLDDFKVVTIFANANAEIMLPDILSNDNSAKFVNVVSGHLCVFATADWDFCAYELWMMMEYGVVDSWTKMCKIEKPEKFWWRPLGFTATGNLVARGNCKHDENTLLVYNPVRKKFKCLGGHLPHLPFQVLAFAVSVIAPVPHPLIVGTS
ncbi:hypothetical protein Dsin_024500 [Dipteronia sinensis]|uniref:F-box associated domain-containing protein n=1 Tax=Dipteronia sinensis TaxID=43782 RepID=A0AAD9ZTW0_9ROSI|nr:hypothetical protein Dsin_024500 [Dipteronia sinensis]